MDKFSDIADAAAARLNRRRFLARAASLLAGGAAAALAPTLVRAGSPDAGGGFKTVLDRGPDAGLSPNVCGIYCSPTDCCTNGCCSGYYLFRCSDSCTRTYFYICSTPCTGFCYSQAC